jgi:hypothetical protein
MTGWVDRLKKRGDHIDIYPTWDGVVPRDAEESKNCLPIYQCLSLRQVVKDENH